MLNSHEDDEKHREICENRLIYCSKLRMNPREYNLRTRRRWTRIFLLVVIHISY